LFSVRWVRIIESRNLDLAFADYDTVFVQQRLGDAAGA